MSTGNTPNPSRPRFNSCRSESRNASSSWIPESTSSLCSSAFSSIGGAAVSANDSGLTNSANTSRDEEVNGSIRSVLSPRRADCQLENIAVHAFGTTTFSGTTSITINGTMPSIGKSTSLYFLNLKNEKFTHYMSIFTWKVKSRPLEISEYLISKEYFTY